MFVCLFRVFVPLFYSLKLIYHAFHLVSKFPASYVIERKVFFFKGRKEARIYYMTLSYPCLFDGAYCQFEQKNVFDTLLENQNIPHVLCNLSFCLALSLWHRARGSHATTCRSVVPASWIWKCLSHAPCLCGPFSFYRCLHLDTKIYHKSLHSLREPTFTSEGTTPIACMWWECALKWITGVYWWLDVICLQDATLLLPPWVVGVIISGYSGMFSKLGFAL